MKLTINGKELEYCPQHGYPLPCDKCGLGQYELGELAGIKKVVDFIRYLPDVRVHYPTCQSENIAFNPEWQTFLKENGG